MHPSDELLVGHVMGDGQGEVARHLETNCAQCREKVEGFALLLQTMREDSDAEPPVAWVERAMALIREGEPAAGGLTELAAGLREWLAGAVEELGALVRPPEGGGLAYGLRAVGSPRRLRFESAHAELDLEVEVKGRSMTLTGQFASQGESPEPMVGCAFRVDAVGGGVEGQTDSLGEFRVTLPSAAEAAIRVRTQERAIHFVAPDLLPESE